jgi:hypothetical protein
MRLKSLARSVSSLRINRDTWREGWGGEERGFERTGELEGRLHCCDHLNNRSENGREVTNPFSALLY